MTTDQKNLVKKTVPALKENGVVLTTLFYKRMFEENPELKHVFNMGNQKNQKQQTALAMAVLAYAEHIDDPSVLLPVINNIGNKHTSLDVRPEHYIIVGKHLLAAIEELLGEAATPDLLEAWKLAYHKLAALMSGHEHKIYEQRINQKGGWAGWRPFIVKKKVKESDEITSFYLYPSDEGSIADFKPGQYISLRLFLPELNLLQPRQYSISCPPNGKFYRISVKRESGSLHPDGMISNRLHEHIIEGDLIDLSSPSGVFHLQEEVVKPKVFISGGVGQTPLLSMLEKLIDYDKVTEIANITWIHGCRNETVHAFKKRLSEIVENNDNIRQHIFYDRKGESDQYIYSGMVELSKIEKRFLDKKADFYICGPRPFISKHYNFLIENNIPKTSIYFEEFGPSIIQIN